jgi:hypothetical protein
MADDSWRGGGCAAAGVVLAIVFFAIMVRHTPARHEAAPAPAAATGLAAERDQLGVERSRLASRLKEREQELSAERRRCIETRSRLAALTLPQPDVTFLPLSLEHVAKTSHRGVLGSRPSWILLTVEVPAPSSGPYLVSLFNPGGQLQWCSGGMRPSASGTMALGLPSDFLTPGKYRLQISGAGMPPPQAEVSFVVEQGR